IETDDGIEENRKGSRLIWKHDEDVRVMSAWLEHSLDPVRGNNKKSDKYWQDVADEYNLSTVANRVRTRSQVKERVLRAGRRFCAQTQEGVGGAGVAGRRWASLDVGGRRGRERAGRAALEGAGDAGCSGCAGYGRDAAALGGRRRAGSGRELAGQRRGWAALGAPEGAGRERAGGSREARGGVRRAGGRAARGELWGGSSGARRAAERAGRAARLGGTVVRGRGWRRRGQWRRARGRRAVEDSGGGGVA
ncbi:hypothetical protein ACJX0J_016952, partial [Zea mays]